MLGVIATPFKDRANVHSVRTVKDAREALAGGAFDIIILDVALPDGPGTLLLQALRSDGRSIPVVIFSAQDADLLVSEQVAAVLTKSHASIDTLVQTVQRLLPAAKRGD